MKPFLGIDITNNKKNETPNGEELLVATPSLVANKTLEQSSFEAEETIEKSKLPLLLRILQWGCGIVGLLLLGGFLKFFGEEEEATEEGLLAEMYQNAPWFFWLIAGCLVIWALLTLWGYWKVKTTFNSKESEQVFDAFGESLDAVFQELNVPEQAKEVDLLSFFYKEKSKGIKVCEQGLLQNYTYITEPCKVFADQEFIYFSDINGKYAVPLEGIQKIETVKKTIVLDMWNKDDPYNKGKYKSFKLKETQYGEIVCKTYHILRVFINGEEWGIYFPAYELPVFEKLTGLTAEEPTK